MQLNFVTVDVFTDRQFGGNPLAVVVDADGLSTEQMQRIAAEFNLAETTFVLPPKAADHTAHVRIFTPRAEMPFAGHPNVGTAFVVAKEGSCYGQPLNAPRAMSSMLVQFAVQRHATRAWVPRANRSSTVTGRVMMPCVRACPIRSSMICRFGVMP